MKIIAETGKDYGKNVFIMEVTEEEAYNLLGFHSSYSSGKTKLHVGDSIKVHEMYDRLTTLACMEQELNSIKAKLSAAAQLIGEALPGVRRAGKKEVIKEEVAA